MSAPAALCVAGTDGIASANTFAAVPEIATTDHAGGTGCVLALKGNQETLHDNVRPHTADPENAERMLRSNDVDKGHGRIETREATVCHDIDTLVDLHHWPGLQAVGKLTATREIKGERSTGTCYFLLSERLDPERFPRTARAHWAVENSLHRVLDVTMGEDSLRNRKESGPENLALMRKLALNLARVTPTARKQSMRGKLKRAGRGQRFPTETRQLRIKPRKGR